MAVAMKGLLKGLRFISHIFEDENERELQISAPTDVRHVAHIGWDGPTASPPSWMDKFKGDGESVASSSPTQDKLQFGDGVQLRSESSIDESPSRHRSKAAKGEDSVTRKKKKKKSSSRTSSKTKNVQETGIEPELEGG